MTILWSIVGALIAVAGMTIGAFIADAVGHNHLIGAIIGGLVTIGGLCVYFYV